VFGPCLFAVTYTDGCFEEREAEECQDNSARNLTFVRYGLEPGQTTEQHAELDAGVEAVTETLGMGHFATHIRPMPSPASPAAGLRERGWGISKSLSLIPRLCRDAFATTHEPDQWELIAPANIAVSRLDLQSTAKRRLRRDFGRVLDD
jgi:hypothetical protein